MDFTTALGWFSSFVLVLTIGRQVLKQYREGSSEGVSKWLFIGQLTANIGFLTYSILVKNWVFVVTNALMLVNAFAGLMVVMHHRRRKAREEGSTSEAEASVGDANGMQAERA